MITNRSKIFVLLSSILLLLSLSCASKTDPAAPETSVAVLSVPEEKTVPAAESHDVSGEPESSSDPDILPVSSETVTAASATQSPAVPAITLAKTGSFYLSDGSVLADIENGSPEFLRKAVSKLKRNDDNYSDDEVTLIIIATSIMNSVWPKEKISWANPAVRPVNGHTEILNSVRQGVYDGPSDRDSADFLSLVLPSLLLTTANTSNVWYDDCQADLTAAAELQEDSPLVNYLLALLFQRRGEYTLALEYAEKAHRAAESVYETGFLRATLLNRTGYPEQALILARRLLVNEPDNAAVIKLCAQSAWAAHDIDTADYYVALVLQREPENEDFLLLRAGILYEKGEYLNSTSLLDAYARRNSTSLDYLLLRTKLYQNWTRNNNAALATISQALSLYPDNNEVLLLSTEIAMATGLSVGGKTGRQLLEELEKADPDNRVTLELLVNQAVLEENWEKAYRASSSLVDEGTVDNKLTHISICLKTNHLVEAEKIVLALYERYPENEQVQQQYIRVLIASGRGAQASVLIDKLLPSAQGKVKSALYFEKSRLESSREKQLADLKSSLTANPRNQDALFSLYEYYFDNNDYRKAQYYLKQLIALNSGNARYLALNTQLDTLVDNRSN